MNWFIFASITLVAWGGADLFYKKGNSDSPHSHLKTSMVVGFVMGLHAVFMLIFGGFDYDFMNIIIYLPVSLMYILSMTVGYLGLRYLELSISSPIQNCSGAVVCIMCAVFLSQTLDTLSIIGIVLIGVGILSLGILEKKSNTIPKRSSDSKYRIGFFAFFLPIAYCVIDSLGTFFDAYYLDDYTTTPLKNVTENTIENVGNTSYELTFLICAIAIFVYLKIKRERIGLFEQKNRAFAAVLETAGQFTYVYAMSGDSIAAAPMVSGYCLVSVILSRIFLKEKLSVPKYLVIAVAIAGIILLGVAEGLSE